MAELKIDTEIVEAIRETPGATPHRIATTLIGEWSGTYTKTRISLLLTTGKIRAVTDPAGRSKLYLPDSPALEA